MAPATATSTRPASAGASTDATPERPLRHRRAQVPPAAPLGSLTQPGHAPTSSCGGCGSPAVTILSMTLTDGTPAQLSSCRSCGHRRWSDQDGALSISDVLARTTRS